MSKQPRVYCFYSKDQVGPDNFGDADLFIHKEDYEAHKAKADKLSKHYEELLQELMVYSQGRRDTDHKPGWEWKEIEIKNESDYEFYPNHVNRETIQSFEQALAEYREIR